MIVGTLTVELAVFEAQTLKDKRRVIQSIKQRLHNGFNISIAEVAYADSPKRCRLGLAVVGNESRALHAQLDKAVELIRRAHGVTLISYERDFV